MNNIFNITESEKNRIRGLHETYKRTQGGLIIEQESKFVIAKYNKKKWGTDNPGSATKQWFDELAESAKLEVESTGLENQTVNLYQVVGDGGEGAVIGQYTVTSIEFRPDETGAFIAFKATQGEPGEPTNHDQWAWYSCELNSLFLVDEKGKSSDEGVEVLNIKFVNALHNKICSTNGALKQYFMYKRSIDDGKIQIVDDADFASNDQQGDDIGGSEVA